MTYDLLLDGLVRVTFDVPMPYDQGVLGFFFPERKALLDMEGRWAGIECAEAEWLVYLDTMIDRLQNMARSEAAVIGLHLLRDRFIQFHAEIARGPIKIATMTRRND